MTTEKSGYFLSWPLITHRRRWRAQTYGDIVGTPLLVCVLLDSCNNPSFAQIDHFCWWSENNSRTAAAAAAAAGDYWTQGAKRKVSYWRIPNWKTRQMKERHYSNENLVKTELLWHNVPVCVPLLISQIIKMSLSNNVRTRPFICPSPANKPSPQILQLWKKCIQTWICTFLTQRNMHTKLLNEDSILS